MVRPKHIAARQLFERVERRLLARFLAPYAAFFAARGIALAALAETDQNDRALVHQAHDALSDPSAPAPLVEDVLSVAAVANAATCERLVLIDEARALPRGKGAEDTAFTAFLDHRALFDEVRPAGAATSAPRGFSECEPRARRPFPAGRAPLARLEDALIAELPRRNRSRYCKVFASHAHGEIALDVVYGRVPHARDRIIDDGEAAPRVELETRTDTDVARVLFDKATARIALSGYPFMKELLRRHLGAALFGDATFYAAKPLVTLEPLRQALDDALRCDDVPGLDGVALRLLVVERPDGSRPTFDAGRAKDVRAMSDADVLATVLAREGRVLAATFALTTSHRARPTPLEVRARDAYLGFDRNDARLEALVRDWLSLRGMLDMPVRDEEQETG